MSKKEFLLSESSNIRSVEYDAEKSLLVVEFRSGSSYRYFQVPEKIHTDLLGAPSKGKFFMEQIRDKFVTMKIDPNKTDCPLCGHPIN